MAAPLFAGTTFLVLEEPDHTGTSLFILGSILLIDRLPARRLTAPLLLLILTAGQFEDLTVRYVAVPAIIAVCAYRALAARSPRSPDTLLAGTALASVPLSALFGRLWVHLGGFTTARPRGGLAPAHEWPHHVLAHPGEHPRPVRRGTRGGRRTRLESLLRPGLRARRGVRLSRGWRGGGAGRAGPNS